MVFATLCVTAAFPCVLHLLAWQAWACEGIWAIACARDCAPPMPHLLGRRDYRGSEGAHARQVMARETVPCGAKPRTAL